MSNSSDQLVGLLDMLCPMHLVLSASGRVVHVGPLVQRIFENRDLAGLRFGDLFEIKRPRIGTTMADLRKAAGKRLHLTLLVPPRTELKGVALALDTSGGLGPANGIIVNLSFGISVMDAVRDFSLSNADFAPTDMAIEMLYLYAAKSIAMDESRKLTKRLQGAKDRAEEQAHTDTLTGVNNRRALEPLITRLIETGSHFILMQLDLDYFKKVNDTLGHAAGDHVLKTVSQKLIDATRAEDTIIRAGGDEFILVIARKLSARVLTQLTDRLIKSIEEPIYFGSELCCVSSSIGSTQSGDYTNPSLEQLMDDSDVALYAAKARGRGCHVAYSAALRDIPSQPLEATDSRSSAAR